MHEMATDARCEPTENGYRIILTPPRAFTKAALQFLDGARSDLEVVLESPVPEKGRCNWTVRNPEGRPVEHLQAPDEWGMRKLKIYAALDPMTRCSFIVQNSTASDGVTYLSHVSVSVTEPSGDVRRMGFMRLQ